MPGWDDILAAAAGGLQGYVGQSRRDEDLAMERRKIDSNQELRMMLETVRQDSQNQRNTASNASREKVADTRNDTTRYGIDSRAGTAANAEAGRAKRGGDRNTTANRALDMRDEHYWDEAARDWDLGLGRIDVAKRGQDIGAATTQRGQDLTHEDRQDAIGTTSDTRAMGYALGAYEKEQARRKHASALGTPQDDVTFADWLQTSDDPEIFPSVRRMFGRGGTDAPAMAPPAAPPAAAPVAPGAKAPLPIAPRAAAPAPVAPPKGLQVGASVTLKSGQKVTVTKVNPDGTFEYK